MLLGRNIRVTHNPDPNVPFDWYVKSAGQNFSRHDTKRRATSDAKKRAEDSRGQIELIVEKMDGSIDYRKTYEASGDMMPSLEDLGF